MSGTATMKAEIVLTLRDASASNGIKAVEKEFAKANQAMQTTASQTSTKATAAVQAMQDSHVKAFRDIARARETLGIRPEQVIRDEIRQTQQAYEMLARSGAASSRELVRAQDANIARVRELRKEMGEVEKMTLRQRVGKAADYAPQAAAGAYVAYRIENKMLAPFATLEQAQTDLRISMTDRLGGVSQEFKQTLAVAQELGNLLPGTTRDFVMEAQALKQKGISDTTISHGGLQAAGLLRVGMGMTGQGEAGDLVAKTMHSFGLKDAELATAADHTFRLYKAFGTKARDITEANTYMGGTLNQLGWTGAGNMKTVQAMQGMLAAKGLESSVFGTNFADMLSFVARNETRMKGKGAETKEVNAILNARGIKLDLFDKTGKFVAPDEFMKQMEKLQVLTQKEQIEVFHKLFGTQGERVATALVQGGSQGVIDAQAKVDNIISLTEAVKQQTATFSGKAEALAGSFENMLASMGKPIGNALKPVMDKANGWAGAATDFFNENPITAGAAGAAAAVTGGAATWTLFKTLLGGAGVPVRVVNPAAMAASAAETVAKTTAASTVATSGAAGASRWALARAAGGATLPLAVMYGVTEWAGDTSNDKGRVGGLQGVSSGLSGLLSLFGINKEADIAAAREKSREGLISEVVDKVSKEQKPLDVNARLMVGLAPGLVLQGQSFEASGGHVQLNTGNLWNGAPR